MRCCFLSDIHGHLPVIDQEVDVVGIAGDIVPLQIQRDTIKSIVWFVGTFIPWAKELPCEKVILVGGNHDFFFQKIIDSRFQSHGVFTSEEIESLSAQYVDDILCLPEKIVYLQDSSYSFKGKTFYGTPWIPVLNNWAFYKTHNELESAFNKIPNKVDVLISHSPGVQNDFGTSLGLPLKPNYGCLELDEAVRKRNIGLWVAGHIHSGNHNVTEITNEKGKTTKIANVSIKDEAYQPAYSPLYIEI